MINKLSFLIGHIRTNKNYKKFTSENFSIKYAGKKQISLQDGNNFIYKLLQTEKPFMVARYGAVELSILKWRIALKLRLKKEFDIAIMHAICNNAGFFPKDQKLVSQFADLMLELSKEVDLLGCFYWRMEDYIIKNFASQAELVRGRGLEPWYVDIPWTRGLKGKKVLVIHPFEETIINQYKKREKLFQNKDMLPEFELKTLKAVQTIAGEKDERFNTWFEALDYMFNQAMNIDFDVAIIGCGAYGFPLAAKLKQAGKQAIHLGGATQYLFGIKSKRAEEENPIISSLFNDSWVRPSEKEKPKNADRVEGGCYW